MQYSVHKVQVKSQHITNMRKRLQVRSSKSGQLMQPIGDEAKAGHASPKSHLQADETLRLGCIAKEVSSGERRMFIIYGGEVSLGSTIAVLHKCNNMDAPSSFSL